MNRLSLSAIAAAVLAAAAFSPALAGHGGHGGRGGGHSGHYGHSRYFGHRVAHVQPHHPNRWHWQWRHGTYGRSSTVYYGGETYPVATPVASCPANCLAKEYLPNGGVVFTDRCTNESALAMPQPRG